jgi:hypothetical protein
MTKNTIHKPTGLENELTNVFSGIYFVMLNLCGPLSHKTL